MIGSCGRLVFMRCLLLFALSLRCFLVFDIPLYRFRQYKDMISYFFISYDYYFMMPFSAIPCFLLRCNCLPSDGGTGKQIFFSARRRSHLRHAKKACHPAAFSAAGRQAFCLSDIRVKRVFATIAVCVCSFRCCKPSVIFRCSHGLCLRLHICSQLAVSYGKDNGILHPDLAGKD